MTTIAEIKRDLQEIVKMKYNRDDLSVSVHVMGRVDVSVVISAACKVHNVSVKELKSPSKETDVVNCRSQIVYFLHEYLGMKDGVIAEILLRDRTTIISTRKRHKTRMILKQWKSYQTSYKTLLEYLRITYGITV